MNTEMTVSYEAACHAFEVLREYLWEGGHIRDVDTAKVQEFFHALGEADRIVILPKEESRD